MTSYCTRYTRSTNTTKTLVLGFNSIGSVPVADASSVSDWNTWFNLPTKGTPFTSAVVHGTSISLIGGKNIVVSSNLFDAYLLTQINDSGAIVEIELSAFSYTLLTYARLLGLRVLGDDAFSHSSLLEHIILPSCTRMGTYSLEHLTSLKTIYIPKCSDLGGSVLDNGVFFSSIGNNVTLTIPASRMTCNAGNPDGDIQYLQANNTVTIVQV
jgi:hypothetical protein